MAACIIPWHGQAFAAEIQLIKLKCQVSSFSQKTYHPCLRFIVKDWRQPSPVSRGQGHRPSLIAMRSHRSLSLLSLPEGQDGTDLLASQWHKNPHTRKSKLRCSWAISKQIRQDVWKQWWGLGELGRSMAHLPLLSLCSMWSCPLQDFTGSTSHSVLHHEKMQMWPLSGFSFRCTWSSQLFPLVHL